MFEWRDDRVWIASDQELLDDRPSIEVGAMAVRCVGEAPELRELITFSLMLGSVERGTHKAEVVHRAGDTMGLHLAPESIAELLQLCDSLEVVPRGHPALPRHSQLLPALQIDPASPAPDGSETNIDDLAGKVDGLLGPGVLRDLLQRATDDPAPRPSARTSLLRVFRYLAHHAACGRLVVHGETYAKTIWLRDGVLLRVDVEPVKEDELLGQILLKARWISPQQLAGALRWGRTDGSSLGATMVRTGLIEQKKLARALAHQTYRRLRDLFDWRGARYHFVQGDAEGFQTPMAVERLSAELALDVLRATTLANLDLLLRPYADCYPLLEIDLSPERFKLLVPEEKTRRVCEQIFDGGRPLRLAIKSSVLGRQRTSRLVLYLSAAGALRLEVEPISQTLTPAQQLSERLRALEVQDPYQRLGLRYRAHPSTIEAAHRTRAASFAEGTQLYRASPSGAQKALAMLGEAQRLLSAPGSRKAAREKAVGAAQLAYLAELVEQELLLAELHEEQARAKQLRQVLDELVD
jgi:hypothetical protein